jgi:putative inorganic carbon (HCO3(-)) transporter
MSFVHPNIRSNVMSLLQNSNLLILLASVAFGLFAGYTFFLSQGVLGTKLQAVVPLVLIAGPAFIVYHQAGWNVDKLLIFFTLIVIPAFLDLDLFYNDSVYFWVSANGFPITLTDILFFPLLFKWLLIHNLTHPINRPKIHFGQVIGKLLLLLLAVNVISALIAPHPFFSWSTIYLQLKCYLFYWFMINVVTDEDHIILVIRAITIILLSQSIIALEQNFLGQIFTAERLGLGRDVSVEVTLGDQLLTRVSGTLGHPNNLAMFINLMLPILIFSVFSEKNKRWMIVSIITIALSSMAELWTASRGGWLALVIALLLSGAFLAKRRGHNPFIFISIGAIASSLLLIVLFFASSTINTRLTKDDAGSAEVRYPLMKVARNMIYENPVLGTGLNNYTASMVKYDNTYMSVASVYNYPVHNTFLLVGGETGLLGIGTLIALSAMLIFMGYKAVFNLHGVQMHYVLGASAGIITWIIHNQVNLTLIWNDFILWVLVSAIVAGYAKSRSRENIVQQQ